MTNVLMGVPGDEYGVVVPGHALMDHLLGALIRIDVLLPQTETLQGFVGVV